MASITEINLRQKDINILVTGFAPFLANNPLNPAAEIVRRLPAHLPATVVGESKISIPPVRIIVTPTPIKVAYRAVRDLIPALWETKKIDMAIHIGMAEKRNYYSIERLAHRDNYILPDVEGFMCPDFRERTARGKDWIWYGLPGELYSDLEIDEICKIWKCSLPDIDLRTSDDPGRYLCNFMYYSSLAFLAKKQRKKLVTFLHVPMDTSESAVSVGIEVTVKLIQAMIQSEVIQKRATVSATDSTTAPTMDSEINP